MLANYALWFLCFIASFWFVCYHWRRRKLYRLAAKIPGPNAFPLIGSAYLFISFEGKRSTHYISAVLDKQGYVDKIYTNMSKVTVADDIVENAVELMQQYGSTIKVWMFNVLLIFLTKPKHVQIVLNNCLEKEKRYDFAKVAFGEGLLVAKLNIWKNHRKIINPAFNQKILNSFMHIFVRQSEILVEVLRKEVEQGVFDVHEYLSCCSLDIICETAMGIKVEAQTKPSKILLVTRRCAQLLVERCMRVWLHPDIIFRYCKRGRELAESLKYAEVYIGDLVMKRYKEFHSKEQPPLFDDSAKKPFLEHLLTLGDQMTFLELRDEVALFITAGSDTITTTTGYVLVCLGMYSDIQKKIVEELDDIFGNTDRPIGIADLPKLNYMERVVKETMRLYPPVPFVARSVTEDVDLGDFVLPAGSSAVIGLIGTHRDPVIWPDPTKFDPDRFLPEEVAKRHPCSFIPFSAGPRNCIGIKFAMMSIKVLLSTILRAYRVDTNIRPEDIKLSVEIVSKMIGGTNISIRRR